MDLTGLRATICVCWMAFQAIGSTASFAADAYSASVAPQAPLAISALKSAVKAQPQRTRFIVGLDRKVDYQVFSLANPNRVIVEFPDVGLRLPDQSAASSMGLVKSFRGGLAAPGKTRVVIDVMQPVVIESSKLETGNDGKYRLSLDILAVDDEVKSSSGKPSAAQPIGLSMSSVQPPLPRRAENPKLRAAKAFKPVIVLDPGHGGLDSGAIKLGTVEKEVVLAFGHVLREHLEKTGRYKVLMTRDKDFFVELDDRLKFGEHNNANLFIAIHADYASSSARGATIFTLRDSVAKDLQRSAIGNAGDHVLSQKDINTVKQMDGDLGALRDILSDLAERDLERTRERTSVFAKSIIDTMGESTPMRQNPDQQAAFRVLKTAQFPSVLIELAYVTNRQDADNLNSDSWRGKVAESIVSAIDNYFGNQVANLPM